jgi:hypothetical protein
MTIKTLTLLDAKGQELAKHNVDSSTQTLLLLDDQGKPVAKYSVSTLAAADELAKHNVDSPTQTLLLLDDQGKPVAKYSVSTLAAAHDEVGGIPSTLEWYRDAAQWMVSAAAATMVLGLGYFSETTNPVLRVLFSAAGVVLLSALIAGGLCYLWVLEYARTWDDRANIAKNDTKQLIANDSDLDRFSKHAGFAYYCLLGTFFIGLLGFSVCCGARMWTTSPKASFAVTTSEQRLLLTDTSSGETFVATADGKTGRVVWKTAVAANR